MDEYDPDEEGQEPESEDEDPNDEQGEGDTVPRAKFEKVQKEARSLRTRLARSELESEFGKDVVELVPPSLPLDEQREYVAKLKERLGQAAPTQEQEGTGSGPGLTAEEPLSESEKRIAALTTPRETAAADSTLTWDEYRKMLADPTTREKAMRLRASGAVDEGTYPS